MRRFLPCLCLIFFLSACEKKRGGVISYVNEDNVIVVSVPEPDYSNPHFFDVTEYADSILFVKLQTTNDNLISTISGLLFTDDNIIVFDEKTSSILFFDYSGNYSHKIQKRGRGPDEYLTASHVMLDRENNILIVHDPGARKMLYYDYDGKLISKIDNFCDDMIARDIINLSSGDFLCYRQDKLGKERKWQAGIWSATKDGTFDKFIYSIDFDYKSIFVQYAYHLSELPDNTISFVDQNQTAVFHVNGDNVSKIVQFNLPGKTEADFPGEDEPEEGCYSIFTSQEKGDYIFTQWNDDKNRGFQTIFTKTTGNLETGMTFEPFAFGSFIPGGSFVRNNDPYIHSSWFFPHVMKRYFSDDTPEEIKTSVEKIIGGITPEQIDNLNPILQLLYIKK